MDYKKLLSEIDNRILEMENDDFDKLKFFRNVLIMKKEINYKIDEVLNVLKEFDFDEKDLKEFDIQKSFRKSFSYKNISEISKQEKLLKELKSKYKNLYELFTKDFSAVDSNTGEIPELPEVKTTTIYQIKK